MERVCQRLRLALDSRAPCRHHTRQHNEHMTNQPPHRAHLVALDGLRGIAAAVVMFFHAAVIFGGQQRFPFAVLAVDLFFMLSGFVLLTAYGDKLASRRLTFLDYCLTRAIRLYPMILISVGLVLPYWTFVDPQAVGNIAGAALAACIGLPWLGLSESASISPLNVPEWSLVFELLISVAFGLVSTRLTTTVIMVVVLIAGSVELGWTLHQRTFSAGFLVSEFWWGLPRVAFPFFLGMGLERVFRRWQLRFGPASLMGCATAFLVAVSPVGLIRLPIAALPVVIAVLFPLIVFITAATTLRGFGQRLSAWAGGLSYPAYLVHMPVYYWLRYALSEAGIDTHRHGAAYQVAAFVLALAVAYAALRWYDVPLRLWLERNFCRRPALSPPTVDETG